MANATFYSLLFDSETIRRLEGLMAAAATFEGFYTAAMRSSVARVQRNAARNAPVKEGTLRRGIRGYVITPWLGVAGVIRNVPYARRREFSFDGQTDSLGRFYPKDPISADMRSHMFYLRRAVDEAIPYIRSTYGEATRFALAVLAKGR